MLRAYWVGLVGLNSVFSDYNVEDTVSSKIYMEKRITVLPKLDESIDKSDRLCSVIFSAAFGFLMAYGWMFFSSTVYILIANFLSAYISHYVLFMPLLMLLVLLVVQIILNIICNLKRFKAHENLQTIYYISSFTRQSF